MEDNTPRYIVQFSDGQFARLTEQEYNDTKDRLYSVDEGANVARINDFSFDDKEDPNANYVVNFDDGDYAVLSPQQYAETKDVLRNKKGVKVGSLSFINPYQDELTELYNRKAELEEELKGLPSIEDDIPADPRAIPGSSVMGSQSIMQERRESPERQRRTEINRELKQIGLDIENNPAWQRYWKQEQNDATESLGRVAQMKRDAKQRIAEGDTASLLDPEILDAARSLYEDALRTASAPSRYNGAEGWDEAKQYAADMWRAAKENKWSAISMLETAKALKLGVNLIPVIQQIQDHEGDNANILELSKTPEKLTYLSDPERELLRAFVKKAEVEAGRADNISMGYQAGQSAIQSIGFMGDFILLGGLAEAGANKVVGEKIAALATDAVAETTLKKIGAESLHGLVKAAIMTPLMPSTYTNIVNNILQFNDEGGIDLSGKAVLSAVGDDFIETVSETIGSQPLKLLGWGVGKALPTDWLSKTTFGAWGRALRHSPVFLAMKQAGWNGFVEEMFEEVSGNALRVWAGIDKNALKDFVKPDQLLITATSFAPMSLLGGALTTSQYTAASIKMRNDGVALEEVLKASGMSDAGIKQYIDQRDAKNPEELASSLSAAYEFAVKSGRVSPEVALKAVQDYAKSVSRYKVLEGIYDQQKDMDRVNRAMEITQQVGSDKWYHEGADKERYVRTLTDENGGVYYVTEDAGDQYVTIDPEGELRFVFKSVVDSGNWADSGEVPINTYLDNAVTQQKQVREQERMQKEAQESNANLVQQAQPGVQINLGTAESPDLATILGVDGGNYIVQKSDGTTAPFTPQEMASKLNIPLTPKTDRELEQQEVERMQRIDAQTQKVNAAGGRVSLDNFHVGIPNGSTFQRIIKMDDGSLRLYYINPEGKPAMRELDEGSLDELAKRADAVQSEEAPVQEETPATPVEDNTPRDFRGNPLPMRTNKRTGQEVVDDNALWNNDPEAWARWNDANPNQRVTSKERLEDQIKDLDKRIEKDTQAVKKAALKGIDADKMDDMEADLGQIIERRGLLASILDRYNLPVAAGPTVAGEQRKAAAEKTKTEQQAGFPGILQKWNEAPKIVGAADEIRLANGETISGHYVLTEATAPTPSHNPADGFKMSEGFPVDENGKTVNDRDYEHDKAAQQAVVDKAAGYDQRALQTPVIVSADGVVLSGNDRTMASQIAATMNTDGAYVDYLTRYSQKYGFSAEQMGQFQHPRVVFVPDAEMAYNAANFAKFNAEDKKSQSKTEKAVKAGKTLTPETLGSLASLVDRYDDINAMYNDAAGVDELLNLLFAAEVITPEQIAALKDGERLSGTGMDLLESTLIGAALDEEAVRVAMADANIRKSVVSAIGQIIVGNTLEGYNLRAELTDAIQLVANGKRAKEIKFGESVQSYVRQQHLFEDDVVAEATVQMLADAINDRKTSFLKKVLSLYNRDAVDAANGQMSLLTQDVPSRDYILRNILEYLGYDTNIIFDTSAREAEQRAAAETAAQPGGNQSEEVQTGPAVQSDAGSKVAQQRESAQYEFADILGSEYPEGTAQALAEAMTDEEIAEYTSLRNAFDAINDQLGEAYSRLEAAKAKDAKKTAKKEVSDLEVQAGAASEPMLDFVRTMLDKYGFEAESYIPESSEESGFDEEIEEDEPGFEEENEDEGPDEPKPAKGKRGSGKKAEAQPYVVKGGASEATIAKQTYTQEEWEEFVYGYSTFTVFESKKTGEQIQLYMVDDSHPVYKDHRVLVSRRLPGPDGQMSKDGHYTGLHTETQTTTDYLIKYLKANKFKPVFDKSSKSYRNKPYKNKYGYWVNQHGVVMNPIRIELPSVKKGWANFSDTYYYQDDSGKWFAGGSASYGTGGGTLGVKHGPYDNKSAAIKATIEALEIFRKAHPEKNTDLRDVDNLIRNLKTKTLPQALLEEGALNNVVRTEITASELDNGVQGNLFGGEVERERYSVSDKSADKGGNFYQNEYGDIDLVKIGKEVTDKMKVANVPLRLTTSMVKHIYEQHKKEGKFKTEQDAIQFVVDVMTNFDHVRDGGKGTYVFSIENGRKTTGRRAITIILNSSSGEYFGVKTSGYEGIEDIRKRPLIWEKGVNETSATDTASANVTSDSLLQGGEMAGNASNQTNGLSVSKDTEISEDTSDSDEIIDASAPDEVLVFPGVDATASVPKIGLKERDGKWYWSTYVPADGGRGSAWGSQNVGVQTHGLGEASRKDAIAKAVHYMQFILNDVAKKQANKFGETFNEANRLIDYLHKMELTAQESAPVVDTAEALENIGKALKTKNAARVVRTLEAYRNAFGEDVADEIGSILTDLRKDGLTAQSKAEMMRQAQALHTRLTNPEAAQEQAAPAEPQTPAAPVYGSQNTIITTEKYEELKRRMKEKLGQLNAGFDPETFFIGAQLAVYHVEAGARKFMDFSRRMISELGDAIRPYLKAIYNGARDLPGMEQLRKEMDSAADVEAIDVDSITIEQPRVETSAPAESAEETAPNEPAWLTRNNSEIQGFEGLDPAVVYNACDEYITDIIGETQLNIAQVDMIAIGSRAFGSAREDSDLDILLEYEGDVKEDEVFNALNAEPLEILGIKVDFFPIRSQESGTLTTWLESHDNGRPVEEIVLSPAEKWARENYKALTNLSDADKKKAVSIFNAIWNKAKDGQTLIHDDGVVESVADEFGTSNEYNRFMREHGPSIQFVDNDEVYELNFTANHVGGKPHIVVHRFSVDGRRVQAQQPQEDTSLHEGDLVVLKNKPKGFDGVLKIVGVNSNGTYNLEYNPTGVLPLTRMGEPADNVMPVVRHHTEDISQPEAAEPVREEAPAAEPSETSGQTIGELGKYTHTKTGKEMTIVRLTGDRLTNDEFKSLKARAKQFGGYYSSYGSAKGFLFDSEEDAIKFNTINTTTNVSENTDKQTAADSAIISSEAASVAGKASALAESEEPADERAVTRTIQRIDNTLEKIDDQLALLGYYEADQTGPFHESYGYMKSAEKKAVKDADRLAKKLAADLGIEVGRKKLAEANIAPAGGDITFRLPLNEGREIYVDIELAPRLREERIGGDYMDDLYVGGGVMGQQMAIMYRLENPNASGQARFEGSNNFAPYNVTYADLLRRIRSAARNYLPEAPAPAATTGPVDVLQVVKEQAEKNRKSGKKSVSSQEDGDAMLGGLFADLYNEEGSTPDVTESSSSAGNVRPAELNGFKVGERVIVTEPDGEQHTETITRFDNGKPVVTFPYSGGAIIEEKEWDQIRKIENEPVNNTNDGQNNQGGYAGSSSDAGSNGDRQGQDSETAEGGIRQESGQEGGRTDTGGERGGQRNSGSRLRHPRLEGQNKRNYRRAKGDEVPKTVAARYKANIAAIRLLKELQDGGKQATKEQMAALRQYTGWGGLGGYFNNEYSPEYREMRSLLTDEELQAAALSINTAYYTPTEIIESMWDVAKRLGFEGGNVLEGSAGIGNILASMPKSISERSAITAVELDNITGGILQQLYPDANVQIKGFQEVDIPNGSVDLAITNVPFGDINVYDSKEKDLTRKFGGKIHDFCIAKNIRKLAEGGIGIFISTRGTLDGSSKALRQWIVNEGGADVIGAFRLNNATFEGTKATSDIIVVRKRVNGQVSPNAIDVTDTEITRRVDYQTNDTEWNKNTRSWEPVTGKAAMEMNAYFVAHPENMGGEMGFGFEHNDTYRPGSSALWPSEKIDQNKRLAKWAKQFSDMQDEVAPTASETESVAEETNATKEGQLVTNSKGEICISRSGKAVPIAVNSLKVKGYTKAQCLADYDALKSAINEVLDYQLKNESDEGLKPLIDKLNRAYDRFAKRYDRLNRNTAISFLRYDVDFPSVAAVEDYKEKKSIDGKVKIEVKKTSIFSGRVLGAKRIPTPANAKDGVIVSINQFGRIDIPFIADALNKDEDTVRKEILASGLGFENPLTGNVEEEYEYLSGNVREKLEYARAHNSDGQYDNNIKALEKVIPADIPAHLIEFSLGSDWMPVELYTGYAKEKFGVNDNFVPTMAGGSWLLPENEWEMGVNTEQNRAAGVHSEKFRTDKRGHELMLAAMNNTSVVFSRTYKDPVTGESVTEHDKEATQAATTKMSEMRDDFKDWCKAKMLDTPELAERISKIYNDTFNAIVPKEIRDAFIPEHFEGQVLTMGKENKPFHLYPHQARAVIRATTEPLMMAHEVGAGKTFTLIATAMEMRRLGTAKKPMIVVQNATLGQFVSSAKELYPNAKILTISEADRTVEGRTAFYAKIKYNDWDIIIVPQSVFEMMPDSEERQRAFIQEKIDEKKFILAQVKEAKNSAAERQLKKELEDLEYEYRYGEKPPKKGKGGKKDAKKEAEAVENAVAKAKKQLDRRTDDVADFDDMGIDALLVDEAHSYKHLGFSTAMQRGVKGVDATGSKKSAGVYLKTRSVFDRVGWKNVVFATGTPISNTAAEIWTFMKYLMPAYVMRQNHIYYFDDFVRNFGNISQSLEFTTSGKFKETTRFASYTNLPELIRVWSSVTDTVRAEDAATADGESVEDKQPKMEGGQARDIYLPQSLSLVDIMNAVRAKLEWYENLSGKERKENSHIPLTMFGIAKMAAIDPRLVDREAQDEPNSKTNKAVEETLQALKDSAKYNGTAALFCDNFRRWDTDASGKRVEGFNIFEEIKRKLVAAGVPEGQIVIMKSGMNTAAKEKIFARVNSGEVRVIMGTTATLGTGVNIQERLFFAAHLDAPNRPMDYTQRNGRILRQGNLHKEWGIPVRVVRFGVEDSLDVTAYQRLSTKAKFIDSIMDGKPLLANGMENRVLEEEEEGEFDNPVAILSGSQYALLKSQAERELRKLRNKKEQHRQDQIYIERTLKENKSRIAYDEKLIEEDKGYLAKVKEAYPGGGIKDIIIEGRKVKGAEQIADAIKDMITGPVRDRIENRRNSIPVGMTVYEDFNLSFGNIPVKVSVALTADLSFETNKRVISTQLRYSCPKLGIEDRFVPGGYNGAKNIIEDFLDNIASGKRYETNIRNLESTIARLNSDNELMLQRRGKPFADEEKLAKQEEIVKDYTEKMRAELAEKEAKYAEMAKNVKTTFNVDNVEVDEDADGEETSAEYADEYGNSYFMGIPNRKEGEDAKTFTERVVHEMLERYPALKGIVSTSDTFLSNLTPEEQDKRQNGHYSRRTKKITIFAKENRRSADGIARSVFHEAIHWAIDSLGWSKDRRFINLFNLSLVRSLYSVDEYRILFADLKARYERMKNRPVSKEEVREEMVTSELSQIMLAGMAADYLAGAKEYMPQFDEQLEKLFNTIGYESESEAERMDEVLFDEDRQRRLQEAESRVAGGAGFGTVRDTSSERLLRDGQTSGGSGGAEAVRDNDREGGDLDEDGVSYELVSDPEVIQRLERGAKGTGYRNRVAGVEMFLSNAEQAVESINQEKATPQQWLKMIESMGAKRLAANQTADACGIKVEFRPPKEMMFGGKPLAGRWINGKMYICLEHCRDNADAVRTVLHEGVGHNGLRRLIGDENMTAFCLDVFRRLPAEARREVAGAAVKKYGANIAEAVEKWLAEHAEVMDFENEDYERNLWDIVRDALRKVLAKVGIDIPLSQRDVRWLLWQSYNANKQGDVLNEAKRQVVANKLGFTLRQQADKGEAVQIARNRIAEEELAPAARIYNKDVTYMWNRLHETWVDKDDSVHRLVNAIEKATNKPAAAFEDIRLALNQQSSKGLAAIEKWERENWTPMQDAIRALMKDKSISLADVERYVMIKHGLERNEVFAKRDARAFYQDLHDTAVNAIEKSDKIDDITRLQLIAKEDSKLKKHLDAVDAGTDVKYKEFRKQDYGGLTAMYSEWDVIEPFMEGIESEEEYQARVLRARHPKYTYMDENGREQVDMAATEDAARAEVAEFEDGSDKAVNELWKRINNATKATLKHQYDANMMSRQQYLHVKDMFKHYVPLRGFADNTAEDMYDYYQSDQRGRFEPPLLKAKGRKTEAESPFGYIGSMASSGIAADIKNETKLALYYFVSNRANNDLVSISEVWYRNTGVDEETGKRIFTPVYPPFKEDLSSADAKKAYEDWEKQMQEEAKAGFAFKGTRKLDLHNSVIHIDKRQETSHVIKFKVGGRDMMMYINGNPRAAQAINNELNVEMSTDYQKVFGKVLRWFSGINTSYNPEFWLSNAQRDALFALMSVNVKEDSEYGRAFRENYLRLLRDTLTPGKKGGAYSLKRRLDSGQLGDERLDKLYAEFVENGGVTGYTTLKNNEEWELELRKYTGEEKQAVAAVKTAFEAVQHFGEAIEQMTRFAAYMTSREQGKEIKDAVNDAKELTVNFNRKGSGKAISFKEAARLRTKDGKKLTGVQKAFVVAASWLPVYGRRFIMFFNASTQGLNAMYKLFKKNPARMGTWAAGYLALGVIQAVIHAMLDDDDDYLDIPDYERRNNLLLGAKGVYFKWALPQEARVFYGIGDMAVNHIMGRTPNKSILSEALASASDIAPLNPSGGLSALAPSAIVPVVEVALNRDYKGSKIYNDMRYLSYEEKKRTPKYTMAFQGTGKPYILLSQFANWLSGGDYADAGWLNINPASVEHLLQGATGGAGTTIGKLYRGTVGQVLGEDFAVRNTPFLSRLLTVTDDRYRNAHTTELFDYYKAEAEHTKKLMRQYSKNGDDEKLRNLLGGDKYQIMLIYESYKGMMDYYYNILKITDDKTEPKAIMREQDAVRKEMIKQISEIGN